jgi:transcriptional regulator NrdR family protein
MINKPGYGLRCAECGELLNIVFDSRAEKGYIRRRRKCVNGHRATTVEAIITLKSNRVDPESKRYPFKKAAPASSTPTEIDYKKLAHVLNNLKETEE